MKSMLKRILCSFLVIAMAWVPFTTQAGMIGSDAAITSAASQADRNTVVNFLTAPTPLPSCCRWALTRSRPRPGFLP